MSKPTGLDYALLAAVGVFWGSQFALNEVAIADFSPLETATGRVAIGALTLAAIVHFAPRGVVGEAPRGGRRVWALYFVIALVEAVLPCFLIPWGQERVDSSVAAILLATVPLFTLVLAPCFVKEERWTLLAALSALVGFAGVIVLFAPGVTGSWFGGLVGELAILGGALGFSLGMILMKKLPPMSPLVATRNVFLIAAAVLVVATLALDPPNVAGVEPASLVALAALGNFCGGLAYAIFFYLVVRTGPIFTSLVNYPVTLFGVFVGITVMGDSMGWNDVLALVLIILALAIARLKRA